MHPNISVNGSIGRATPELSVFASSAVLYGKGIFTTVRIIDREPFLWPSHWRRLSQNAAKLGIDLGSNTDEVTRAALDDLLRSNNVVNGRARITFLDESSSHMWPVEAARKTGSIVMTGDLRRTNAGVRLGLSPYIVNSRSPLAGIKSCNYMERIVALDEARARGLGEAVQVDDRGNISSACMANVFWSAGGELLTPALSTGCIRGTTREFVLANLECREVEAPIGSLAD